MGLNLEKSGGGKNGGSDQNFSIWVICVNPHPILFLQPQPSLFLIMLDLVPKHKFPHTGITTMKEWTGPELTVLVRSKPEEGVLTGCKTINDEGGQAIGGGCVTVEFHAPCNIVTSS